MENRGKHVKDMEDSLKKNLTCITGEPRRQEERELRRMNRNDRSQITAIGIHHLGKISSKN